VINAINCLTALIKSYSSDCHKTASLTIMTYAIVVGNDFSTT